MSFVPITVAAASGVAREDCGLASDLLNTIRIGCGHMSARRTRSSGSREGQDVLVATRPMEGERDPGDPPAVLGPFELIVVASGGRRRQVPGTAARVKREAPRGRLRGLANSGAWRR